MKIAIVADKWKKETFSKRLTEAGYDFKCFDGPHKDCVTFQVVTIDPLKLQKVVTMCNDECAAIKARKH